MTREMREASWSAAVLWRCWTQRAENGGPLRVLNAAGDCGWPCTNTYLVLGTPAFQYSTPTELCQSAQGWCAAPTLGAKQKMKTTSTRLWRCRPRISGQFAATALRLESFDDRLPKVARASKPWALGRNPV